MPAAETHATPEPHELPADDATAEPYERAADDATAHYPAADDYPADHSPADADRYSVGHADPESHAELGPVLGRDRLVAGRAARDPH